MQLGKRDRGPRRKQLVGTRQIDPAGRLGKGVVLGLELACGVDQEDIGAAGRGRCEIAIDVGDGEQRLELRRLLPVDQQRLALVELPKNVVGETGSRSHSNDKVIGSPG